MADHLADGSNSPYMSLAGRPLSRRKFFAHSGQALGAVTAFGLVGSGLAACSSSGSGSGASAPTSKPDAGVTLNEVNNAHGTVNVVGWPFYQVPQLNTSKVTSKWGYITLNEDTITKTSQPGAVDLVTMTNGYEDELIAAGRVIPTNPELLSNWSTINPAFRNWSQIRRQGEVYSVPLQWSYGYLEWNKRHTKEPTSLSDLFAPALAKKIGLPDDPYAVITTFGRMLGFPNMQHFTRAQFSKLTDTLNRFRPQVLTLHQYGEEPALLGSGDIWIDFPAYGASNHQADAAGAEMGTNLLGSWSYLDATTMIRGADLAPALSFMNHSLTTEAQAALAIKAVTFPVVDSALDAVPKALRYSSIDSILSKAPLTSGAPYSSAGGYVPFPEWVTAWERFKAL